MVSATTPSTSASASSTSSAGTSSTPAAPPAEARRWPWLLPPALALLLLGAHFLRAHETAAIALCVVALALLALPQRAAARLVQAALLLGTAEWLWTLLLLVQQRAALGRPWWRLALILGAVAVLTALSAWAVQRARLVGRDTAGRDRAGRDRA